MNDRKEYLKKYRLNNKEKYRQYQAKYRKSHLSTYEKTKEENQKLQQRINKAIEYIEETTIGSILEVHCGEEEEYTEPLLKILKGE